MAARLWPACPAAQALSASASPSARRQTSARSGSAVSAAAEGVGAAALGHPALSTAWLANKLSTFGVSLEPGDIVISGGTGTNAYIGRPAAGKTGTAQAYVDAWFCGYVPQLAACVWVGYPEGEISLVNVEGYPALFGGTIPALIWRDFMLAATEGMPVEDFVTPSFDGYTIGAPTPPPSPTPSETPSPTPTPTPTVTVSPPPTLSPPPTPP